MILTSKEDGSKSGFLYGIIGQKFDPQRIAVRCQHGWQPGAAKNTVLSNLAVSHFRRNRQAIVFTVLLRARVRVIYRCVFFPTDREQFMSMAVNSRGGKGDRRSSQSSFTDVAREA